jgi:hypothetical protein
LRPSGSIPEACSAKHARPSFVVPVLRGHQDQLHEAKALAGDRWQDVGLVFPSEIGTPADERNVLRRFQRICSAAGLPKLRVYDLRHTHASLLINEGVHPKKISERLGHSSIKLTMDTYGHLFEGSDRDSADKVEKLLAPKEAERGGGEAAPKTRLRIVPKAACVGFNWIQKTKLWLTKWLTKLESPLRAGPEVIDFILEPPARIELATC